jgi:hypothetical protein
LPSTISEDKLINPVLMPGFLLFSLFKPSTG